jgi:hypothetical protein
MYQWAEIIRMARGRGMERPKARHASVYRLRSRAFIGLPCPKKTAGIGGGVMADPYPSPVFRAPPR